MHFMRMCGLGVVNITIKNTRNATFPLQGYVVPMDASTAFDIKKRIINA